MITKKLIISMRVAMAVEFDKRADAMARKLGMPTRAQAYARSAPGRTAARRAKIEAAAIRIGTAYHDYVGDLYVSKRGEISYGKGGFEHRAYLYARSCRFPAIWRDGGARVERGILILENHLGAERARMRMPKGKLAPSACLLLGDCYAVWDDDGSGAMRFGADNCATGYAMLLQHPTGSGCYWEHGTNPTECIEERERKALLALKARMRVQETAREARRVRLLARISTAIMVTRDDAAATGACAPGIQAWCNRVGAGERMAARDVVRLAAETGERRALAAALLACRKALAQSALVV